MILRLAIAVVLMSCEAGQPARAQGAPAPSPGGVIIEVLGDRMSISADAAPLADVLLELGRSLPLVIVTDGEIDATISLELQDRTIDDVVARLLGHHSYILSHRRSRAGDLADSPSRLQIFTGRNASAERVWLPAPIVESGGMSGGSDRSVDVIAQVDRLTHTYRDSPASLVSELAAILGASTDASLREEAVYALGSVDSRSSIDALAQALSDPSERVREAAVYTISESGSPRTDALLGIALTDASAVVRDAARDVLAGPHLATSARDIAEPLR